MRTVERIIEARGGLKEFFHIKIENSPYMPLTIEGIGKAPTGNQLVSVAHYFTQNGDLCADPDMVFEVVGGEWRPVYFQMAIPPVFSESILYEDGTVKVRLMAMKHNKSFARTWDKNLREQGFLDVAKNGCSHSPEDGRKLGCCVCSSRDTTQGK